MQTIDARNVDQADLTQLTAAASSFGEDSPIGLALLAMAQTMQAGEDVVVAAADEQVTPSQAARLLGMSRTHLYKVMDMGDLAFVRVGRDRRVKLSDLLMFARGREQARQSLAERFAHRDGARDALIRDIAGVEPEQARRLGY